MKKISTFITFIFLCMSVYGVDEYLCTEGETSIPNEYLKLMEDGIQYSVVHDRLKKMNLELQETIDKHDRMIYEALENGDLKGKEDYGRYRVGLNRNFDLYDLEDIELMLAKQRVLLLRSKTNTHEGKMSYEKFRKEYCQLLEKSYLADC